jgi:hypothetical protein
MSIKPLLDPNSADDKTLNIYCNSITTSSGSDTRTLFEPNITNSLNYPNPESCQGDQGNFNWILEQDEKTATIYGQYRAQGTNKDAVLNFELPTTYDATQDNNLCVVSSGRSIDINGNPNGVHFVCYETNILSGTPNLLRLFWRSSNNADDPVNDFKYFRFTVSYKK